MKKLLLGLGVVLAMVACQNQPVDFPDYTYQTVYFPIQYPVRTLVLGESRSDNSIDLEHAFSIGASIGGMYENLEDRSVKIRLAPELVDSIMTVDSAKIQLLPAEYYTLSSADEILIPAGSFNGTIRVDLKDAFFEDTLAVDVNYVIPLVITEATEDSVLAGTPSVDDPDRRRSEDWVTGFEPKDYTLFAVKYINPYHGTYLHRGVDYALDAEGGIPTDTAIYQADYIEQDMLTKFTTKSMSSGVFNRLGMQNGAANRMKIDIDGSSVTVSQAEGGFAVEGIGKLIAKNENGADQWGGESRMTMQLDYTYEDDNGVFHHCMDTLVYRDNDVAFEEFQIIFEEPVIEE